MNDFQNRLIELNTEVTVDGPTVVVTSPQALPDDIKQEIKRQSVPFEITFRVGPKARTSQALWRIVTQNTTGGPLSLSVEEPKPRHALLNITGEVNLLVAWPHLCKALEEDGYFNSWECGELFYNKFAVKALQSHKWTRQTSINKDDLLNLEIALGSCHDVNDFINSI